MVTIDNSRQVVKNWVDTCDREPPWNHRETTVKHRETPWTHIDLRERLFQKKTLFLDFLGILIDDLNFEKIHSKQ